MGDGALLLTGPIQEVQTQPQAEPHARDQSRSRRGGAGRAAGSAQRPGRRGAGRRSPQWTCSLRIARRPPALDHGGNGACFAELDAAGCRQAVRSRPGAGEVRQPGAWIRPALLLQPVRLAMGAPVPLTVDGRFTSRGFRSPPERRYQPGPAAGIQQGVRIARRPCTRPPAVGASSVVLGGAGTAALDLDVRGKWLLPVPDSDHPVASSTAEGSIAIRNAELTTSYLSQPLRIVSAQGILSPNQIAWTNAIYQLWEAGSAGNVGVPDVMRREHCLRGALLAQHRGPGSGRPSIHIAGQQRRR